MDRRMTDREFYKSFLRMTITVSLQNLIVYGVNLADSVMMGAYNETSLAGVGICNNIQFLLFMIIVGICNGATVLSSRYWGARDIDSVHRISAVANFLGIVFPVVTFVLCAIAPGKTIALFTDKAAVSAEAVKYLDIIKYSYLIYGLTQVLIAILRSVEVVKIGFYMSLSSFGINILLNYLFIFGKAGFPEMGVRGAALATLISRSVEFAVVLVYVFTVDKRLKLTLKKMLKPDKEMFVLYIKTGGPLFLSSLSWGIAMSVQGGIIGRMAESAIAANSIVTTLFQISSVICYAASGAVCVLTAKMIGEREEIPVIRKRVNKMQLIFIVIGVLSSALLILCKTLLIGYYDTSAQTLSYTNQFTAVLAVTVIGTTYEVCCLGGIVSGGGETDFVFKNDIIFMWLIVLPVSALSAFVFKFPPVVTFACLKADQVLKCAVAFFKVRKFKWIKSEYYNVE